MTDREPINTPSLAGWAIAAAVAVVGFAISYLVVGLGVMGSALIAVILLLAVGIILDMSARTSAAPAARQDARSADPVASSPAAPAAPAPVASAPAARVETTPQPAPEPATPAPVAAAELPADSVAPSVAPARPQGLDAARDGQPDDLKRIKGVGPALEGLLNRLGYFHFDQIAAWTPEQIAWVDQNLEGFKGRVTRDDWVAQARVLAAGGDTEFSARAK